MIHTNHAASNGRAAEIVHGQVRASLILVLEPPKAPALAGVAVARKLQENGLAELGEDGDDIAFREFKRKAAKVDKGGVAIVDMPGGIGGAGNATFISFGVFGEEARGTHFWVG